MAPRQRFLVYGDFMMFSRVVRFLPVVLGLLALPSMAQVSVLTQHNDNARTGANLQETTLKTDNVNVARFGKLFTRTVSSIVWAQPLYVPNVAIANKGTRNVLYVMTEVGDVFAFDADNAAESAPLWERYLIVGTPGLGLDYSVGCPVIDLASNTIFLVVKLRGVSGAPQFRLHALDIRSGADRPNSPVTITASVPGTGRGSVNGVQTLRPGSQKQRPGLLLANGNVYIAFGASVDELDPNAIWNGWVIAYNATTLQRTAAFMVSPDANGGGIWHAAGGLAADAQGNVYAVTGNGQNNPNSFSAGSGGRDYGNSIIKLSPSLTLLDYFTPFNQEFMERTDQDLGSGGPMLVPGTNLLVSGEKLGSLYIVDRSNMGRYNPNNNNQIVQNWQAVNGHLHGAPAYWNGPNGPHIYVWSENDFFKAFKFNGTSFNTTPAMKSTFPNAPGMPGGMLSLSANGATAGSGIIWASMPLKGDANKGIVPGIVRAFDANNLGNELWNSEQLSARDRVGNFAKFACVTVANGKVYVPTFSNQIHCYGLLPTAAVPGAPTNLTATGGFSRVDLSWTAPNGATSYNIKRATSSTGAYSTIARNVTATKFADTGVTNGRTYYYVISAVSSGGEGANSNQANARPFAPAGGTVISIDFVGGGATNGTPSAMAASEVAGVVAVSHWNAATGNVGSLSTLTTNGGGSVAAGATWTCLNTSSTPIAESPGNFRMMKGYLSGNNTSQTQVRVTGLPASFTSAGYDVYVYVDGGNPTATRTGNYVIGGTTLTATDGENMDFYGVFTQTNPGDVSNYIVFRNLTSADFTLDAVPGESTDTTPRAPVNGIQIVQRQTLPIPPTTPLNLTATPGVQRATLTWSAATRATSYTVKRATSSSGPFVAVKTGLTTTNFTNTGLTAGTTYHYVVSAVNSGGESSNSNVASVTPTAPPITKAISINFVGSSTTSGIPAPMGITETAGAVKTTHWNNASGASGTKTALLENGGVATSASATWAAHSIASTPIAESAGNARLMKGHLNTGDTTTTTVTVSGLPAGYVTNGYDVYVYVDGDNGTAARTGKYAIGTRTPSITDAANTNFSGSFKQANNGTGNLLKFSAVTGASFTLTATPGAATDNKTRAPINGIQIVALSASLSPPTIAIAAPANGASLQTFTLVSGTASATNGSGITKVEVAIGRLKPDSTYEFWDGTVWKTGRTYFVASYNAGSWTLNTNLPTGANLPDGNYLTAARATDGTGQIKATSTAWNLDRISPQVAMTSPVGGATLSALTQVNGTFGEGGSGLSHIDLVILRLTDNKRWDGTTWVNFETGLVTTTGAGTWSVGQRLPSGANLPNGQYTLKAVAYDKAGNVGVNSINITISTALSISTTSSVDISTANANTSAATITLTFSGALMLDAAQNEANYNVAVNGKAVALEGAAYNAETKAVTLALPADALHPGDTVTVTWRRLTDSTGRPIAEGTATIKTQ
jgi:hypothetical protein